MEEKEELIRKEIEEAIRTTLVISNPKGIQFAVDKIYKKFVEHGTND